MNKRVIPALAIVLIAVFVSVIVISVYKPAVNSRPSNDFAKGVGLSPKIGAVC